MCLCSKIFLSHNIGFSVSKTCFRAGEQSNTGMTAYGVFISVSRLLSCNCQSKQEVGCAAATNTRKEAVKLWYGPNACMYLCYSWYNGKHLLEVGNTHSAEINIKTRVEWKEH